MLVFTLIINATAIRRLLYQKVYCVCPLHPDHCGGLTSLSAYSLKTVYLVALMGLTIAVTEYHYGVLGLATKYWVFHLSIPLYVALGLASFFAPLSTAHRGMKDARDRSLQKIARQFQDDYADVNNNLNSDSDHLKNGITRIQQLQTLYDVTGRFPVWPFDTGTLRRLIVSITAPLLPAAISIFADLLRKIVR